MTGKEKFCQGLIALGFDVRDHGDNRVSVPFHIQRGRFQGQHVRVGIDVPGDFDFNPPTGPHVSPRPIPINQNSDDPHVRMHNSPFGDEWGYLSRPFRNWNGTSRTVKEYMRWITHLLETL